MYASLMRTLLGIKTTKYKVPRQQQRPFTLIQDVFARQFRRRPEDDRRDYPDTPRRNKGHQGVSSIFWTYKKIASQSQRKLKKKSFSGDVNDEANFPFVFLLHKRAKPASPPLPSLSAHPSTHTPTPLPCATP
jgi:hypothetical protein